MKGGARIFFVIACTLLASCSFPTGREPTLRPLPIEGAMPSAGEVFKRHLDAVGGASAYESKRSMISEATIEIAALKLVGTLTLSAMDPNLVRVRSVIPGVGLTEQGFDGTSGWTVDPQRGFQQMSPAQIEQLRQEGNFRGDLLLAQHPGRAEVIGLVEFAGTPCWQVVLPYALGAPKMHFYSRDTGLFRGATLTSITPNGNLPVTVVVDEYRPFGDVLVATRTTSTTMGQIQRMTISEVRWNAATAEMFRSPPGRPQEAESPKAAPSVSTGTCFAVHPQGWLVTADHVVEGATTLEVQVSGLAVPAKVVIRDAKSDLALIKIEVPTPAHLGVANDSRIEIGRRVYTLGYPAVGFLSQDVRFNEGTVSSVRAFEGRDDLFQISVPLQPGNSGGPLIDDDGVVIGIVVGKAKALAFLKQVGSLPENISFAVDSDRLLPMFKTAGIEPIARKVMTPADASNATYLVICR